MAKTPDLSMDLSRLPLPDIRDDIIQYTQKQCNRREDSNRFRPPKYKPRYDSNFNRSHHIFSPNNSHIAQAISFRNDVSEADTLPLTTTTSYNSSANETFFEQSFTRLSKIGEGSFGEVFKVRSKEDGRLYAVKMSKQMFRGELYRAERLEEVRRYEQFSGHENCIRFYRAWEQDDRLFMQMELCRESLETYLWRRKEIPEERIWSILLDLLLALKSLHDRNLLHLDIKLDNVLIDDDETCKLADFGLVIDVDKANRHQATEGDSRYIAPEIMEGNFSKAADIFSLGIAMLELSCFLELPANGPLWQELRKSILPEEFLKNISLELHNIIKSMMTPDPRLRPTVDQLLAHKHFETLLQQRNHWQPIRQLHRTIRRSCRFVWSKLCNIRCTAVRLASYVFETLHIRKAIVQKPLTPKVRFKIIGSTPIPNKENVSQGSDFLREDPYFDISQNATPTNFASHKMLNSTPLYKDQNELKITPFVMGHMIGDEPSPTPPYSNGKPETDSATNSFIRRPQDTSTLRRKLFTQGNDT